MAEPILAGEGKTAKYLVAVIGAGPAGLFAAKQLCNEGVEVVLINRDVKPGGLAEYGIYPDKLKMKEGLRAQFRQILNTPSIHYFGNLTIGNQADITLNDLFNLGFDAVLVTVGAQGTKWLGLPGENLTGVYHAKDLVYHYNRLPPFSQKRFEIGKRVAVIGMGNVMTDIAYYLIRTLKVDEVVAIGRRGPNESKYERKEMERIVANLDLQAYEDEIQRTTPLMLSLGQDPQAPRDFIQATLQKAEPKMSDSRLTMRFLSSPICIHGDAHGRVTGLEIEENTLVQNGTEPKAKGIGTRQMLDVDTVIFAIGDRVDNQFGLPVKDNVFIKCDEPLYPVEGISYEAFDPITECNVKRLFIAGWSRQASVGLVGVARKDGTNGAKALSQYLKTLTPKPVSIQPFLERLGQTEKPVIRYADVQLLESAERAMAERLGLDEYKYATNEDMLRAIRLAQGSPLR